MTVTGEHPGLDGLTFDADGNVYVTDAHQGISGESARWAAQGWPGSRAHC